MASRNFLKMLGMLCFSMTEICCIEPKPYLKLYTVTTITIAHVLDNVAGNIPKEPTNEDWFSFENLIESARQKVTEAFTGVFPNDQVIEENINSILNILPDFPLLQIDWQQIAKNAKEWNWDKFANEMLPLDETFKDISDEMPFNNQEESLPPECSMTSPEIIKYSGFPCEVHPVKTNDGYVLELHRIPFGRKKLSAKSCFQKKRPVVFFQHGLLGDSACWISNGVEKSLPFILADAGFDVWLGNVRGSTYSRKHMTLNADIDEEFWRFSWQHMSQSDLPAMINTALRISGQRSLYYIGHSQGTLIAFARLSEDPLFNKKIRMMFAFGPVSALANITSPVKSLVSLVKPVQFGMSLFGGAEFLPKKAISRWMTAKLHALHKSSEANESLIYHGSNMMMYMCGVHPDHYHQDRLPIYFSHTPAGTSIQNLVHFGQMVATGKMQKWDYMTAVENERVYGQATVPEYNVSRIQTPIVLFVGSDDQLADPEDNLLFSKKLKSLYRYRLLDGWDHLDFLWGKKAVGTIYNEVLDLIKVFHLSEQAKEFSHSDEL